MNTEYSKNRASEYIRYDEYQRVNENPQAKEYATYNEYQVYEESTDNEGKTFKKKLNADKKNRALASMSTGVVSAIAAAAFGITSLINVNMNAEFKSVEYVDGLINYEVAVEKMTQDESLVAYLYNDDELQETIELIDDDADGIINGSIELNDAINENENITHNYRLSLAGDVGLNVERQFDSYVVQIENKASAFKTLSGECHCGEDGYYYFDMDFSDDERIFLDFEAYITDSFGNVAKCEFNDDLHSTQRIYVLNLKGSSGVLTLNYKANGEIKTVTIDVTM